MKIMEKMEKIMTAGTVDYGMPFDDYCKIDAINASALKYGCKSILHMRTYINRKSEDQTSAMKMGTLLHAGLLEPEKRTSEIVVWKKEWGRRGTKLYKAFCAENEGKEILTEDENDSVEMYLEPIRANSGAMAILSDCKSEVTLAWKNPLYGYGKARIDGFSERYGILEYKTTGNIEADAFMRTSYNMHYQIQLGWYAHAVEMVTGKLPQVTVLAQEQRVPCDCFLSPLPPQLVKQFSEDAVHIAKKYHASRVTGTYPGVSSFEDIEFYLPGYAEIEENVDVSKIEEMGVNEL